MQLGEKMATFLEFVVKQNSPVGDIKHYGDDFLFDGKASTSDCHSILQCFLGCSAMLGVPIASDKTVAR